MADFKIPELGESVAGGDVTRVMVKVGDTIARDQAVLELETDKATIEVPSSVAGVVTEVKVKKGDKIQVGALVLTVDDSGAAAPEKKGDAPRRPRRQRQRRLPPKRPLRPLNRSRRISPSPRIRKSSRCRSGSLRSRPRPPRQRGLRSR